MQQIISRLKEPSTWAGIGAIAVAFGLPSDIVSAVVQAIIGLAGLAAVVMPEQAK